jgi:CheY-like chemotaxis protein
LRVSIDKETVQSGEKVLLDVVMPAMGGYEVRSWLKENEVTRSIAVIFVTTMGKEANPRCICRPTIVYL